MNKVLVIDDSLANLFLIQSAFEGEPDISLSIESESVLAINTVRRIMPDLILLDLMMPNIDGFQLLERIRSDMTIAHIPTIIITAMQGNEFRAKAADFGVIDFIQKPLDLTLIRHKVVDFFSVEKVR